MDNTKEVFFNVYCSKCVYKDTEETDDPCNDCLAMGYNLDSHKPVRFKENDKKN